MFQICVFLSLCVPCASTRQIHFRDVLEFISYNSCPIVEFYLILYSIISLILSSTKFLEVRYLPFDTNLSRKSKKLRVTNFDQNNLWLIFVGIIVSDISYDIKIAWIVHIAPNLFPLIENLIIKILKFRRLFHLICMSSLTLNLLVSAVSPASHVLSLMIVYISCIQITKKVPPWVPFLLFSLPMTLKLTQGLSTMKTFSPL